MLDGPHSGAQLSFTDHDGHRFQATLTDQPNPDIQRLKRRQRQRAHVEEHIRNEKDTGLRNMSFKRMPPHTHKIARHTPADSSHAATARSGLASH
jgi:hypothetical protein